MYACLVFRENKMSNKLLIKAMPLITAALLLTMLAAPVFATGAHLWFYSVDPATLPGGYPPLVNPQPDDPNWTGVTSDPWTTESVVVVSGDWDTPFSLWIGNADPQDDCYDTTLVISVNNAAAAAISGINITTPPIGAVPAWDTVVANFPLPPHGISNSAEYYGFAEVIVGNIVNGSYIQITIDIDLNTDLTEAKIHFDAYGWSTEEHTGKYNIFSPFSHDFTFVIPEAATIVAVASSLVALGIYAYKRKKQ
jgi:hypothetical protein